MQDDNFIMQETRARGHRERQTLKSTFQCAGALKIDTFTVQSFELLENSEMGHLYPPSPKGGGGENVLKAYLKKVLPKPHRK